MNHIGPHEGRELELMLAAQKPLAMFVDVQPIDVGLIPDESFAPYVEAGKILKRELFEPAPRPPGGQGDVRIRVVLYALPSESWRIEAMVLLRRVYSKQGGWDEGLERMIGALLGYEDRSIDFFLERLGLK